MAVTACSFPFAQVLSTVLWLILSGSASAIYGLRAARQIGTDPAAYRKQWSVSPSRAAIAMNAALLCAVFPVAMIVSGSKGFCDGGRDYGLLLFAPAGVGLAIGLRAQLRLVRIDRTQADVR